jgi:hypothetical protein
MKNMRKRRVGLGYGNIGLDMRGNEADSKIVDGLDGAGEGHADLDRAVAVPSDQAVEVHLHGGVGRQPGTDQLGPDPCL